LNGSIYAVATLRALRSIVIKPGEGTDTELKPMREALFQYDLQGVIDGWTSWNIAPIDVLVLGKRRNDWC
jgi:hypothetical protein